MTKTVLFDMDGVLIDATEWHYEALNESLEIFGFSIPRDEHLNRFNGMTTRSKLEILSAEKNLPRGLHDIISDIKQDRTLRIAARMCFPNASHLILLSSLKERNIKVGVVTNSIRLTSEFMLEYAGLTKYLDVLITNEDVASPKPAPDGYRLAMARLQSLPEETVVVEDGDHGVAAAVSAGARVVKVRNPGDVSLELIERIVGKKK
jgi:HAD superfamily hydrolase (TIGR01509 family)